MKQMQLALDIDLQVSDAFGYWFSGFFDGEGCIYVSKQNTHRRSFMVRAKIRLRYDDWPILQEIKDTLQIGALYYSDKTRERRLGKQSKDQISWEVTRIADCYWVLVPLFEKYPLRSKKKVDFEYWKEIVEICFFNKHKEVTGYKRVLELKDLMEEKRGGPKANSLEKAFFSQIKDGIVVS